MKRSIRATARLGIGALALATGTLVVGAGAAFAAAPYVPDPHAMPGGVFLLNSAGKAISGGASNTAFGAQVAQLVATGQAEAGWKGDDPAATGYGAFGSVATPVSGTDPAGWSSGSLGPTTTQATPTAPPHATTTSGPTLESIIATGGGTSAVTDGSGNAYYEVRLGSINDDLGPSDMYYAVDITVNTSTHTWHVVDQAATQTSLTVSPTSPASSGTV